MDSLEKAADQAARDFLTRRHPTPEFHVTVARNAILDCLLSSPEPDFIAKITADRLVGSEARRVIDKLAPHLVTLAGRAFVESRA
jgi:hypothetical protein